MPEQGNKRSHEMNENSNSKRQRGGDSKNELRLLIVSRNAGAIIGKGGEKIKNLREKYQAKVIVPDSDSPERVFTIGAELDVACELLLEVLPTWEENKDKGDEYECEVRILVHQSQAGAIIGKGGSAIKKLRDDTGAQFKVYSQICPNSTDRVVQITGKPNIVGDSIFAINTILQENPPKGVSKNYDARDHDDFCCQDYGGYTQSGGGGRRGGGGGDRGGKGGMNRTPRFGGGGMGNFAMREFNEIAYDAGLGRNNFGMGNFGRGGMMDDEFDMPRGGRGGMNNFGDFGGGNARSMKPAESTQVSIPKDMAGAIIGKSGQRIRNIRNTSGADINIADPKEGESERIITIKGDDEQIAYAQFLMQKAVKEFM